MNAKPGVLAALQQTATDLNEHRQTHVVWRDWLRKDPANVGINPHAGSAEFHDGVIADYDRHLANITATSDALVVLAEALGYCESWFAKHSPTAALVTGEQAEHPMLTCIRAALARAQGGAA